MEYGMKRYYREHAPPITEAQSDTLRVMQENGFSQRAIQLYAVFMWQSDGLEVQIGTDRLRFLSGVGKKRIHQTIRELIEGGAIDRIYTGRKGEGESIYRVLDPTEPPEFETDEQLLDRESR